MLGANIWQPLLSQVGTGRFKTYESDSSSLLIEIQTDDYHNFIVMVWNIFNDIF